MRRTQLRKGVGHWRPLENGEWRKRWGNQQTKQRWCSQRRLRRPLTRPGKVGCQIEMSGNGWHIRFSIPRGGTDTHCAELGPCVIESSETVISEHNYFDLAVRRSKLTKRLDQSGVIYHGGHPFRGVDDVIHAKPLGVPRGVGASRNSQGLFVLPGTGQ